MYVNCLTLSDLAELEPAENMTDVTLSWDQCLSIKEVFLVFKGWQKLRQLKLTIKNSRNNIFPPVEVLGDFIMGMKQLSYLHIASNDRSNDGPLEILRDEVNELILPRRPNFKFDIYRWDD